MPKTTNVDLKIKSYKLELCSSKLKKKNVLGRVDKRKLIRMNLGSADRISGWLACVINGSFRTGVLFMAFSNCTGGSCKMNDKIF